MTSRALFPLLLPTILGLMPVALQAQGRPYTEGSVWEMTMVRTTAGMTDDYLGSLVTTWKRIHEEAKKQGFVVSYRVLSAAPSSADDWDLLLIVEYKNWAALDSLAGKYEPIERQIVGTDDQARQLATKRLEVRRIIGTRLAQELILK